VTCPRCGASLELDRAACFRAMIWPLAGTVLYVASLYLVTHLAEPSLVFLVVPGAIYVGLWLWFSYRVLCRIPLRIRVR
jgi:hypothetical protein